jgi:hypothetical protein
MELLNERIKKIKSRELKERKKVVRAVERALLALSYEVTIDRNNNVLEGGVPEIENINDSLLLVFKIIGITPSKKFKAFSNEIEVLAESFIE